MEPAELRFRSLFDAHYGAVYRYALRRTDRTSAEEVAAETFEVAWRRLGDVPREDEARPWLIGVARRVLANMARSSRRASMLSDRLRSQPDPMSSPDFAETVAERQQVLNALSLLSPRDQEAMKLVGWDDLSIADAAVALGCSRAALTVRLHRARQKVRRALPSADSQASSYADSPSAIVAKGL